MVVIGCNVHGWNKENLQRAVLTYTMTFILFGVAFFVLSVVMENGRIYAVLGAIALVLGIISGAKGLFN